jgi:hypothetical protein
LTRLFGFVQLDFAGRLAIADGRYVVRDGDDEQVLVVETLGAPPPARRRRRRPREVKGGDLPAELPLTRVTVVRAFETFEDEASASAWLASTSGDEQAVDRVIDTGLGELNRGLHTQAVASGEPTIQALVSSQAVAIRIGYGSGDELADGLFTAALQVDQSAPGSRRRQRDEELRPQQRIAAVLGGRERLDACETLLLRARADLDAGRTREAALQLRVGLEALLVELDGALSAAGHEEDMTALEARRGEVGELANAALAGEPSPPQLQALGELLSLSERILRRRRVLSG